MASIERRNEAWRVRWRDPDGTARARKCPDKATAQRLLREVERANAEGRAWEPPGVRVEADLRQLLKAYIAECARVLGRETVVRYAISLDVFVRWLAARHNDEKVLPPSLLTRRLLGEYYDSLATGGRHGRTRSISTRVKLIEVVERAWAWLAEQDDLDSEVPRARRLRLPSVPKTATVAPTWDEMDACILSCNGWYGNLASVLRLTGLRVGQAMRLRWDDIDPDRGLLTVRPELGKSKQERCGRRVPVSPHLVAELKQWSKEEEWLVHSDRQLGGPRERGARAERFVEAWKRAGVRPEAWKQRPHHAFRKGFVSGLKRAGADPDAIECLVGHSLGLRGVYIDPEALPLHQVVSLIPPIRRSALVAPTAAEIAAAVASVPRAAKFEFGAALPGRGPVRVITMDGTFWSHTDKRGLPIGPQAPCAPRVPPRVTRRENILFVRGWRNHGGEGGI